MRPTLVDWRFVAFVSTLLMCGALPASANAAPQSRRGPARTTVPRAVRLAIAGDAVIDADATATCLAPSQRSEPVVLSAALCESESNNTSDDDDDDDALTAIAAPHCGYRVDRRDVGSVAGAAASVYVPPAQCTARLRGPPRARLLPAETRAVSHHLRRRRRVQHLHHPSAAPAYFAATGSRASARAGGEYALIHLLFFNSVGSFGRQLLRAPPP